MPSTAIPCSELRIIVTGGARGIGAATVRLLAAEGAHILIADVLEAEGSDLAGQLGPNVHFTGLDVTSPAGWARVVETAVTLLGGLNSLMNNAGIVSFTGVAECEPDGFRKVLDVNLFGAFLGIRACIPALTRAGGGTILNVSSTAGLTGYGGLVAYVTSKWGLRGLTKAAALDLAGQSIRVVSLHPGPVRTPMTEGLGPETVASQPIPRFGEAEEIARMARFILTEATYSTGSEFIADGGALTGQRLLPPGS